MTTVIGICGKKCHGKDTVADYLVREFHFTKISLGDSLKRALQDIFGLTVEQLWGNQKEVIDPYWKATPRELMQFIGTDLLRVQMSEHFPHIGQSIWVMSIEKHINDMIANGIQRIIIPDMRFPNEEQIIRKFGGIIIRVERPEYQSNDTHVSENVSSEINADETVTNTILDKLYKDVETILKKYHPSMFQNVIFDPRWD